MKFRDSLRAATDSLRAHRLRSALTALGIMIGVAAVVAMVAIGAGAEQRIDTAIENIGSNLLVVGNGSQNVGGRQTGRGTLMSLTEQDASALAQEIPAIQVAAGSVAGTGQVVFGNKNWSTTLRGVTPDYFVARNWTLALGRPMTAAEERSSAKVALLGNSVADELFGGVSPLGRTIRITRVPVTIIGVMDEKGPAAWGSDQDDVIFMPISTAKKRVLGNREVRGDFLGQITVKATSAEAVKTAERDITELLRRRHQIVPNAPDDFFVSNVAEMLDAKAESSRVMTRLLASVASISLLVGGIGIMNIMLVSVTERTREIGIRMAVGAKQRDILRQFVIEAVLLSLFGGLVGIALGIGGSIVIAHFAEWPVHLRLDAVVVAVLFSAAVGIFFGYYPARKAARLDPIEALRQE